MTLVMWIDRSLTRGTKILRKTSPLQVVPGIPGIAQVFIVSGKSATPPLAAEDPFPQRARLPCSRPGERVAVGCRVSPKLHE